MSPEHVVLQNEVDKCRPVQQLAMTLLLILDIHFLNFNKEKVYLVDYL